MMIQVELAASVRGLELLHAASHGDGALRLIEASSWSVTIRVGQRVTYYAKAIRDYWGIENPNHRVRDGLRWTPFAGQFGSLDKLGPGYPYAANLCPTGNPAWASAGVRPPRAEWGRSVL